MKKDFIKGLVIGGLLFGITSASALTTYTVYISSFPVFVNGKKWVSSKQPVIIEGSTYLPLKDLGNALGVTVNWDSVNKEVEISNITESKFYVYSWCTEVIDDIEKYMDTRSMMNNNLGVSNDKIIENLELWIESLKYYKSNKDTFFLHCKNLNLNESDVEKAYEAFVILLGSFEDDIISARRGGINKTNIQYYLDSTSLLSLIRLSCD